MQNKKLNKFLKISLCLLIIGILFLIFNYIGMIGICTKLLYALYPLLLALLISFLLEPSILFLTKHKLSRPVSVVVIYLLCGIVLVTIIVLFVPSLFKQIKNFMTVLPSILDEINIFINNFFGDSGISFDVKSIFDEITDTISNIKITDITNTFSDILYFTLSFVGAIFLSFDYPNFTRKMRKIIPRRYSKSVIRFFEEYLPYIYKYIKGISIDSIILFVMSSISLSLVKLDYAFMFSLIIAFFNLIPMIGAYIGGAPAVLVAFTSSNKLGITVLIVILILQLLESNFIQPYILRNIIQLHPFENILSLIVFGSLFGIVGMIVSPLAWTALKIGVKQYKNYKNSYRRKSRFVKENK